MGRCFSVAIDFPLSSLLFLELCFTIMYMCIYIQICIHMYLYTYTYTGINIYT